MKRYIARGLLCSIFTLCLLLRIAGQPLIGTFPPQVHQQICQESTYTRYLDVFNYGDSLLVWNAFFTPGPYEWVTASPLSGEIEPGDTIQVAFYFNSAGLVLDNYYAYLQINSNDPFYADTIVLAMLHVQQITIFIEPENDSICAGCNITLHTMAFGCSEEYNFNWTSDPPGFTSTEKNPVVTPHVNTTYTVHVTDGGGSADKSVYIQVYGSSDIAENQSPSNIEIYPNPTNGRINIKIDSQTESNANVRIKDLSGRLVYSCELKLRKEIFDYTVDPGRLEPGIYTLSIEDQAYSADKIHFRTKVLVN